MKSFTLILVAFSILAVGCTKETTSGKAQVELNSAERAVKKTGHRVDEAACGILTGDNKVQCLAKKVKNRAVESKDVIIDKASEI